MKYIAFLDILGFKELISCNSLNTIIDIYRKIFANADMLISDLIQMKELEADDVQLSCRIISDSIIIWTSEANFNSFVKLAITTNALFHTLFILGMPLRGSIEIGELEEINVTNPFETGKESPVLVGSGITKAYMSEKSQNWSGCIISDDTISHFKKFKIEGPDKLKFENLLEIGILQKYKVPLKRGEIKEYYVLDWPYYFLLSPSDEDIRRFFSKNNKEVNSWEIEEKIVNTLNFIRYSQKKKDKR